MIILLQLAENYMKAAGFSLEAGDLSFTTRNSLILKVILMDVSSLPLQLASSKTYRHFTLHSGPERKADHGQVEFFYIGKNTLKIDFLIQTFNGGYAAENAQKAISVLSRIAQTTTVPDIIFVDQTIGLTSLLELIQFISDSKIYSVVPLVLDASGLYRTDLEKYRNLRALDEIIFLDDTNKEQLRSKIEFLKKVKKTPFIYSKREVCSKIPNDSSETKNLVKRLFDFTVSLLLILLLSPVFLLIAVIIKLESRGPVLYVSKRAGRGFQIFNFYKFRTMVLDADQKVQQLSHLNHYNDHEENGSVFFKAINDSRITRVGAFLRNTSMDELPQFFNVFLGNMSFVGNRPLPLYEAVKLTTDDWAERFMAPAGITGLWQIKKREHVNMTIEERIELDIAYSKNYNFMYDLWIMANTPSALIQKSNS